MITSRRKLLAALPASLLIAGSAFGGSKLKKDSSPQAHTDSFITPKMFGAEPGEIINGETLSKMMAAGGDIRFIKPGVYLTDRTLIIRSNTRLWIGPGVTIKLADNSNCNLFQNESFSNKKDNPDERIEIFGPGTLDFNGVNQKTSGLSHMCSILKNISNLQIGGGLKVINANKYAWLVAKVNNFTVDGLTFDTFSDGLHCQPPIKNAYIRNLKGKTGDDMLAFTIGDYVNYDISEPGDFTNIDVAGLFCEDALCAVKITGNATGIFDNFNISGVYGRTQHAVIRIWGDSNLLSTVVKNISVSDVHANPSSGYPVFDIDDRNFASGKYGVEIYSAVFRNIFSSGVKEQTVRISSTVGTMIHNLTLDTPPLHAIGIIGINHTSTIVENLTICNGNTKFEDDVNSCVVLNRGTINRLTIDNYRASFVDKNNGSIGRMISSCSVDEANFINVRQENGISGWININSPMISNTRLNLVNYTCNGKGRIAQVLSSSININMKNVSVLNGSPSDKLFYVKGGDLTLSGDIDCEYNILAKDNGGVINTTAGMHSMYCDVALLNAKDGASVINTNDKLPCGLGVVIANQSTWKNLATGAIYTIKA